MKLDLSRLVNDPHPAPRQLLEQEVVTEDSQELLRLVLGR